MKVFKIHIRELARIHQLAWDVIWNPRASRFLKGNAHVAMKIIADVVQREKRRRRRKRHGR